MDGTRVCWIIAAAALPFAVLSIFLVASEYETREAFYFPVLILSLAIGAGACWQAANGLDWQDRRSIVIVYSLIVGIFLFAWGFFFGCAVTGDCV